MKKSHSVRLDLNWSKWVPVASSNDIRKFSIEGGGIFRISHIDTGGIEYVGRSYDILSDRIRHARYYTKPDEEPDGSHFIASPHLWRLKEELGPGLLVSWVEIPSGDTEEIDAIWAAYLAEYRSVVGKSPAANFGKSTRIHGDLPADIPSDESQFSGFRNYKAVDQETLSWENWHSVFEDNWMGLDWGEPFDLAPPDNSKEWIDPLPRDSGVYRTWIPGSNVLDRIEATSDLRKRIHKMGDQITDDHKISISTTDVVGKSSRTELEIDLLGAHYLATNVFPDSEISNIKSMSKKAKSIIDRHEDSKVEFKEADANGISLAQEMVALANSGGGHVFVGVDDDRNTTVMEDIDGKTNQISNIVNTNIEPTLSVRIRNPTVGGDRIIWVKVPSAYKRLYSVNGSFFTRSGPTKRPMEWSELEDFLSDNPGIMTRLLGGKDADTTEDT